jgi:cystathionine beta-lyase/cystathionine gamma-synthase
VPPADDVRRRDDDLVRISVGIEDVEDLREDLDLALAHL